MKGIEKNGRLITCFLPKGQATQLLKALNEHGITRFAFAFARGFDIHDPPGRKGIPEEVEKEMVHVVAKDKEEGEIIFNLCFEFGGINRPGGGVIFLTHLSLSSRFLLPEISAGADSAPALFEAQV